MLPITVRREPLRCPGSCFSGASIKVKRLLGEEWWPSVALRTHTLYPVTDRVVPCYTTPLDSAPPDENRRRKRAGGAAHTHSHTVKTENRHDTQICPNPDGLQCFGRRSALLQRLCRYISVSLVLPPVVTDY